MRDRGWMRVGGKFESLKFKYERDIWNVGSRMNEGGGGGRFESLKFEYERDIWNVGSRMNKRVCGIFESLKVYDIWNVGFKKY